MSRELALEEVVLVGRTFIEYKKMFKLAELNLAEERILDVASGVASFGAEARELGYDVVSSDQIYDVGPTEIEAKCAKDLERVMSKLEAVKEMYKWDFLVI